VVELTPHDFAGNHLSERETNMRKMTLFKVLVVLVLCVVGVGFYRGWFVVASHRGSGDTNKVEVNLTVDPDKAAEDAKAVETKVRELTDKAAGETPSSSSKDSVKLKDE